MKIILTAAALFLTACALIVYQTNYAEAQAGQFWYPVNSSGPLRPINALWGLRIPALTNCDTIDTDADGDFVCGTDGGGGGGSGLATTSIDTEIELETILTDVTDVFTNNDTIGDANIANTITVSNYLSLLGWFSTTTHALISSLPSLSITESQISNLDHYTNADVSTYLTDGTGVSESSGVLSFDCSDVEGTGIDCSGENITLDATGAWTGTFDGMNVDVTGASAGNILGFDGTNWVDMSTSSYLLSSELDTYSELNTLVSDVTLTHNGLIDTSLEIAGIVGDEQGSGALVFATSPALTTPNIGAALGTSLTTTGNIEVDGTGNAFSILDRNANTNFAAFQFQTNNATFATIGGYNDSTSNLYVNMDGATAGKRDVLKFVADTEAVFNDGGGDLDFRVEGDTVANLLVVDASSDRIGIASTTPGSLLSIGATQGINLAENATSTFGAGINILDGCFAVAGTCLSIGGGSSLFTDSGDVTYLTATGDAFTIGGTATASAKFSVDKYSTTTQVGGGGANESIIDWMYNSVNKFVEGIVANGTYYLSHGSALGSNNLIVASSTAPKLDFPQGASVGGTHVLYGIATSTTDSASNSTSPKTTTAWCPTGYKATGGGGELLSGTVDDVVASSFPTATTSGWTTIAQETDADAGNWQVRTHVICTKIAAP